HIAVTGITLSDASLTLYVGDNQLIYANVLPWNASVKDIAWSSTNNSVAQIDATGRVSAVSAGTASVIATTAQGGYSATCYVTVLERIFNLNTTNLTLRYGESTSIAFETLPAASPVWSSDNSSVASVTSAGVVTAGYTTSVTTIRATANGISRSCVVNVVAPVVVVSGVSLDRSAVTLLSGGNQATLTANILPSNATNKTVIWSSSNLSVASVSAGVITSNNPGSCIITATTSDGGYSATCNVTVESPNIPVTSISLNHTSLKLDKGESRQLYANVSPVNATDKSIEWISSDESVASIDVDSGLIVAKEFGVTVITAKNVLSGVIAQCVVSVYLPLSVYVSTNEIYSYDQNTDQTIGAEIILYARVNLSIPSNMSIVNSVSPFVTVSVNYSYLYNGIQTSGITTLLLNNTNNNDSPGIYITGITQIFSFISPMSEIQIINAVNSFSYSVTPGSAYSSLYHITW
ncbi:MAG: Ig-like domain-containing protein, partial [Bacteroidales bacterium]|nr:Ig-like domain-containing protein [Bacteroidales bacterium]